MMIKAKGNKSYLFWVNEIKLFKFFIYFWDSFGFQLYTSEYIFDLLLFRVIILNRIQKHFMKLQVLDVKQ